MAGLMADRLNTKTLRIEPEMLDIVAEVEDIIRATGAARGTLKDHLKHLMKGGYLVQHGKGKGTWYSLP